MAGNPGVRPADIAVEHHVVRIVARRSRAISRGDGWDRVERVRDCLESHAAKRGRAGEINEVLGTGLGSDPKSKHRSYCDFFDVHDFVFSVVLFFLLLVTLVSPETVRPAWWRIGGGARRQTGRRPPGFSTRQVRESRQE